MYDSIAGPDPRDLSTRPVRPPTETHDAVGKPVEGATVGVVREAMDAADDEVATQVRKSLVALEAAGVETTEVSLPRFEEMATIVVVANCEFAALFENRGLIRGSGTGYAETWRAVMSDVDWDALGEGVVAVSSPSTPSTRPPVVGRTWCTKRANALHRVCRSGTRRRRRAGAPNHADDRTQFWRGDDD